MIGRQIFSVLTAATVAAALAFSFVSISIAHAGGSASKGYGVISGGSGVPSATIRSELEADVIANVVMVAAPGATVALPAWTDRNSEFTFVNEGREEVCISVVSAGFNGGICVPGLGKVILAKLFGGAVTIVNKSAVASIRIHGRWL